MIALDLLDPSATESLPLADARLARAVHPVLVATDGSHGADAALRVGLALARLRGGAVDALGVYQPLPAFDPLLAPRLAEVDRALERELAGRVREQVERLRLDVALERCAVMAGPVPETIAREAERRGATLVVLGIGRHGAREVVTGHETALDVMRLATVPVLAVSPERATLPSRAVVALDFSRSSELALRAALELVGPRGTVYLVHVLPRVHRLLAGRGEWDAAHRHEVSHTLREAAERLRAPEGVRVERAVLVGEPEAELRAFAASVDADLIATGSHGYGGMARALIGSVSTQVLRRARCSVLVAPAVR